MRNFMTNEERQAFAKSMFEKEPRLFPEERRAAIIAGVITLGMTPYEAKLAGGAFAFEVAASRSKWTADSDPYKVMWAQSLEPDDSKIRMTFKNLTQSMTGEMSVFRVEFEHGAATSIEVLNQ
jgi:hypothetical protein